MICPVCHLELSKASLRSHLSVDHSERQLQLTLQADAVPVSNANREKPVVFTPEAKELLSQLDHARRLHNQNLLSQRKALSTLSRTLMPASPLKGSITKEDVKGYPQRLQNGSYSPRESIDQMLVQSAQGKHAGTNFAADVTACSCRMHQRTISSLEVSLREKKKQVVELTQKLKQEMEKLEDKEMVISDLNTFLQETAEKQSNARAQLEGYMDNLITRTVQAENEVKNLQMLSSPSSSMNRSSGSFSPRGTPGVAHRVERRQNRSPSMELKRTLQEIRWKDGKGTPSSHP
ncbi:hypothetical protein BSL78_29373 [Apostichopus japonicus]|uniref:Uncharacterized protein n=1 Tax=Stichopus japonicus TaxID=307972 RepID=A0A2G8JDI0_STIJA|nr:hypothetical protein BSL78_29373 [Apostichopus japonicus]